MGVRREAAFGRRGEFHGQGGGIGGVSVGRSISVKESVEDIGWRCGFGRVCGGVGDAGGGVGREGFWTLVADIGGEGGGGGGIGERDVGEVGLGDVEHGTGKQDRVNSRYIYI